MAQGLDKSTPDAFIWKHWIQMRFEGKLVNDLLIAIGEFHKEAAQLMPAGMLLAFLRG